MIDLESYDFVDIGCSAIGAIPFLAKIGGNAGIGVSTDASRVNKVKMAGQDAVQGDPAAPETFQGKTKFALVSQYLERLESFSEARKGIGAAIHLARQIVFIRLPWFDSDGPNLRAGVKMFWSDWKVHTLPLTSLHFHRILAPMLAKGAIARFVILGNRPILDSSDDSVLPLMAGRDSRKYDAALHGEKAIFPLPVPTFAEMFVLVARKDPAVLDKVIQNMRDARIVFDTGQCVAGAQPTGIATPDPQPDQIKAPTSPAISRPAPPANRLGLRTVAKPFPKR